MEERKLKRPGDVIQLIKDALCTPWPWEEKIFFHKELSLNTIASGNPINKASSSASFTHLMPNGPGKLITTASLEAQITSPTPAILRFPIVLASKFNLKYLRVAGTILGCLGMAKGNKV